MRGLQQGIRRAGQRGRSPAAPITDSANAPLVRANRSHSHSLGNQDLQRMLARREIQAKLTVNQPNDRFEQEADRVADQVMRMPDPARTLIPGVEPPKIQRLCSECQDEMHRQPIEEEEEMLQTKPGANSPAGIQRLCAGCQEDLQRETVEEEEETLQGKSSNGAGPTVQPGVESRIHSLNGHGRPLPNAERSFFESRLGRDFSDVRVHTGPEAGQAARAVNARAFTLRNNIVFGSGEFRAGSEGGRKLLAHELTHVMQQTGQPDEIHRQPVEEEEEQPAAAPRGSGTPTVPDVQRTIGDGHDLTADRFSGNARLEAVYDNERLIRNGNAGTAIRLIQESLVAQGYTLPRFGADGKFGSETETAVREFQVDAGAEDIDGIVGPETMGLLDIHDPGGTTATGGGGGAAPPAATGATFDESPDPETFAGYDDSVTPNWLVVPVDGRRQAGVTVAPSAARPAFTSVDPAVATVGTTPNGVVVTGVSDGNTRIEAREGGTLLDSLRIEVKDRREESVAFHYICDSAVPPHCSNGTPSPEDMRSLLNRVWERQANVRFTDGGSGNFVAPGNLGATVDDDGFGGGEMGTVTALGGGADYNVFRVWDVTSAACGGGRCNGAMNNGNNTMVADASCGDGLGLPHEAGHFLGLGHAAGFIMDPCGTRTDQRVSKAMADTVNP